LNGLKGFFLSQQIQIIKKTNYIVEFSNSFHTTSLAIIGLHQLAGWLVVVDLSSPTSWTLP
jgi:hypothetical protein